MLFRETTAVYFEKSYIHYTTLNALHGKNAALINTKPSGTFIYHWGLKL
jgi:hypothetical protein